MDTIPKNLKPLTITFVLYQNDDMLGKLLALISLIPIFIMVAYAALLVFNRDTRLLLMLCGQILNEAINYTLKRTIKQPRPSEILGDGTYGMPSSHSQFVCFWSTYCLLYLNNRIPKKFQFLGRILHLALIVIPILVVYSRVYLNYHTYNQVIVGALLGVCTGYSWFLIIKTIEQQLIIKLQSSVLGQLLSLETELNIKIK